MNGQPRPGTLNAVRRDGDTWHVYVGGKYLGGFDQPDKAKSAFRNALARADKEPLLARTNLPKGANQ